MTSTDPRAIIRALGWVRAGRGRPERLVAAVWPLELTDVTPLRLRQLEGKAIAFATARLVDFRGPEQ